METRSWTETLVIGTWIFLAMESITFVSAVAARVSVFSSLHCIERDGDTLDENKR
jgi:hypothetical protein